MKLFFLFAVLIFGLARAQTVQDFTAELAPSGSSVNVEWVGETGGYYYLQCSGDLKNWTFAGTVDTGDGSVISYGFPTTVMEMNFRVVVLLSAPTSDSDGDGLTDGEEMFTYFTDPDVADTDGDGATDGEEVDAGTIPWLASDSSQYVLEVTWPQGGVNQYFLTKEFWLIEVGEAVDPDWYVDLGLDGNQVSLDLRLRSFTDVEAETTLNVLNYREWPEWGVDQYRIENVALVIPLGMRSSPQEEAEIDPSGRTAMRVNVPPIGLNQVRIGITIEGVTGYLNLIDMGVQAVVVIDPGHGGNDSGAVGRTNKAVKERDLALSYSLRIRDELVARFSQEGHGLLIWLPFCKTQSLQLFRGRMREEDIGQPLKIIGS